MRLIVAQLLLGCYNPDVLNIGDRTNSFYWQTDRKLTADDYKNFFLNRQEVSVNELVQVLKNGVKSLNGIKKIVITSPDEEVKKGNVNIVRKVKINDKSFIARIHPKGVKNEYFYAEAVAQSKAISHGIPAPKVIEVHESVGKQDFDFVIAEIMHGVTMETAIKNNNELEPKLLFQAGLHLAKIHQIEVEKYGSFNNHLAKNEGILVGLQESYKQFVMCGLEENLKRILLARVIDEKQASLLLSIINKYNFEPDGKPKLIHNDYADWNILVDKETITGILDWDECHGGDPVADLASWSLFYEPERLSGLLEGYKSVDGLPKDFELKFHYYKLRYSISKMALRVKRAQVDDSEFIKDKIKIGEIALADEMEWFGKNSQ